MSGFRKPHGLFNARKCAQYLRWIGADVDDALLASWLDAEKSHRFLARMKTARFTGRRWRCQCGHHWFTVSDSRRRRLQSFTRRMNGCPKCGRDFMAGSIEWVELHDGTLMDYRPVAERWRPMQGRSGPGA